MAQATSENQVILMNQLGHILNQKVDNETGEVIPCFQTSKQKFTREYFKNESPSQTVPGQVMTITEMMERYRGGQTIPVNQLPYGEDGTVLPKFEDLTDLEQAKEVLKRFNEKLAKVEDEKKKQVKKAEREKIKLELIAEMEKEKLDKSGDAATTLRDERLRRSEADKLGANL